MVLKKLCFSRGFIEKFSETILILIPFPLRWYGHVLRKDDDGWVKKCMEYGVGGFKTQRKTKEDLERGCT